VQKEFVDTFRSLRDHGFVGKPKARDADDLAKLRHFQAPSKGLRKTLARSHEPAPELRGRREPQPEYEFFKAQMALLGGSRTIVPAPAPLLPRKDGIVFVEAPSRTEHCAPEKGAANRPLRRTSIVANAKMVYAEYEPDMFDVIDAFGTFEAFKEAIK
jgi:hypothetical protein